jgi:hypothetical protein
MQQLFFIADLIACSTCFRYYYVHNQELESITQLVAACGLWCLVFKLSVRCCSPQTGHTTFSSTPYRQLENQAPKTTGSNQLCNTLKLLMMGIMLPETCWASNKICNKKNLLHLVGILFQRITLGIFADNTTIFSTHEYTTIASLNLQELLHIIEKWLKKWEIKVNESKSWHITFSLRKGHCPAVNINQIIIPQTEAVKYLRFQVKLEITHRQKKKNKST